MSRRRDTIEAGYFDALYSADPDPWRFRTSAYEHDKYRATIEALDRPRYAAALEVGCAIGVLTRQLAARCDRLLAIDGSSVALAQAQRDCAALAHVDFACRMVPAGFPSGRYDLIVLSEVLYYLTAADLEAVAQRCCDALQPGGTIVLCHWLGETDYPLTGDQATDGFAATALRRSLVRERLAGEVYRLERFRAP
ncbi:SAM-dependent methyltransferase [Lichenihabitans sp. Uapishka_5]|uniref:class I SAM-dependent methyltransferase n=1 Tax=Lichenihabitans sp. Uapishka_5 TaxID=3037302 RepID=UPI0029E8203A|nr:SAM-dependent methyltransferase [Lichenihabitans sp. Uapishka_5]MDX7951685.1 SAM-dependent methyltransferase [Lichenihabitans sp. Uapishka_5]